MLGVCADSEMVVSQIHNSIDFLKSWVWKEVFYVLKGRVTTFKCCSLWKWLWLYETQCRLVGERERVDLKMPSGLGIFSQAVQCLGPRLPLLLTLSGNTPNRCFLSCLEIWDFHPDPLPILCLFHSEFSGYILVLLELCFLASEIHIAWE